MGFFLHLKCDRSLMRKLPRIHNLSLLSSHDYIASLTVELISLFPVPDSWRLLSCLLPFVSFLKSVFSDSISIYYIFFGGLCC